jgi:hypothetical protein
MSDDQNDDTKSGDGGGGKKKPPKPKLVELPRERTITDRHKVDLVKSGLTDETCKLAELYTEIIPENIARIVGRHGWPRVCGNALVFPFYLPGETTPHAYRIKPTNPRKSHEKKRDGTHKLIKYDQAAEHGQLVYYAPRARIRGAYGDITSTLYWTEGEKKALVLDQLGFTCIGLTGVWNYGDLDYKRDAGGERLHERLRDHALVAGRAHVICYDADSRTNDDVMMAAGRLAGVLLAAGATSVKFICPPSNEHKGIDDYFAAYGEEITRQLLSAAETIEPISPKDPLTKLRSIKALRDAPIEGDMRLPPGYSIDREGTLWSIGDEKHGDSKVARAPIIIQRYLDDYYTGEGRVEVCFERDNRWAQATISRKAIVDSKTLVGELAIFGAPVTSNNASRIIDWFDDLERVNVGRIPRVACVARTGWHEIDGQNIFVLDEPVVIDGENKPQLAIDNRGDRKKLFGSLRSVAADKPEAEAEQLEQAHLDALRRAWRADDVCAALIAGALAAPLLQVLKAPNFGVHLPGDSSRGKTSMLKIAGSVYGDPNSEQWVANWNITPVAAELRASTLADLPQLYDEAGVADEEQTQRLVYMLINGGGKARGNVSLQLRETPSWHTIVLSTGERRLADDQSATGAQIRIIHLPVSRFGDLGADGVDELRETCIRHAGAFGRMWIESLLSTDDWRPIREAYKLFVKELRAEAKQPLQARLANYVAVLCVAEHLAAELGLGDKRAATMKRLFSADSERHETVLDLAERSRELALNWSMAEVDAFPPLRVQSSGATEPDRKGAARVLHGYRRDDGELIFIPAQFKKWCSDHRMSSGEVLNSWKERGWLDHAPKRLEKQVRIGSKVSWLYVLTGEATGEDPLFTPDEQKAISDAQGSFL